MNAIEITGLRKAYPDFELAGLDLCLPGGCIMGLIGENGAGKSTTIRLILDMIKPDAGSIKLFGRPNSERALKEDIGVVLDEVGFPDCLTAAQANKVLRKTYKNWDEDAFFGYLKKLSIPESKPFGDFSRGMKMKLGIAAALSHNSKLLILDEATSGLDPVVRDEVVELFSDFTRDEEHSVLISSHIVSDLEKLCDYIAFLHQGRLMLCEEKDALLAEYCFARGTAAELDAIDRGSMIGRRDGRYGSEAIIRRAAAPAGLSLSPVSIEELFIFMVKEGGRQ